MRNIAILIPSLKAGGAEKQATLLAKLLDKHYAVDIFLLHGDVEASPANLKLLVDTKVCIHALSGGIFSKICRLRTELRLKKTDVLFNYLTSCDALGTVVGRWVGVPRIYGGIRNERVEWWKVLLERFAHNCLATKTIYNCYSGAEAFSLRGFDRKKNIVIPNCFPNISSSIVREDRDIKHIVTVGRFVPQKDYLTMIRTIAELKQVRDDFVLNIIGYGKEEQNIRRWIDEYGVDDKINIYINPTNVQDIVKDGDIYLSTSLFEGTSNSIMEALNWSLPVVATNVGDNNYLVLDGKTGNLHPIGDYKGIASSLSTLLESLDLRNSYGVAGNQNLKDNYSIEVFEQRYLKLIEV